MKAAVALLLLPILLSTCATSPAWQHGPGFSMHDSSYFMESPYIAQKGNEYFLRWRYGSMGFYFFPESRVQDGRLIFSLQVTSSSGSRSGRLGEVKIAGERKIHALETGGAFWWEPDGQKIQLKIVKELSNKPADNVEFASRLAAGRHRPGVPEPER